MTEYRGNTATIGSAPIKPQPWRLLFFLDDSLPPQSGPDEVMALSVGARLGIFYFKNDDLPHGPLLPYSS